MSEAENERLAREERNAYHREYRRKNKEKIKKQQADYWRRKAEQRAKTEQQA